MSSNPCIYTDHGDLNGWQGLRAAVWSVYAGFACCCLVWMAVLSVTTVPLKPVCANVNYFSWETTLYVPSAKQITETTLAEDVSIRAVSPRHSVIVCFIALARNVLT